MRSTDNKPIPPFSLRLTPEERAQLELNAVGMSLGAYIRSRLFDDSQPPRRTRGKHPVKDHQALAQVLGELGRSHLANNLNQLAKAANSGSLEVTPDTDKNPPECVFGYSVDAASPDGSYRAFAGEPP